MDQSEFYGVVSAINFTLYGLWLVAAKDRRDRVEDSAEARNLSYLVSLQFVIPGTASLLAQVAPEFAMVWRVVFGVTGVIGILGVALLARSLRRTTDATIAPAAIFALGVPTYLMVIVVAVFPHAFASVHFKPIQIEAMLVSLLVFLGVQEAWFVSMTPPKAKRVA